MPPYKIEFLRKPYLKASMSTSSITSYLSPQQKPEEPLFFALYRAEFLSLRELIEAFEREEKIEIIKEVYSSISKPEGSA